MITIALFLLLLQLDPNTSPATPLKRLRAKTPVNAVTRVSPARLAGQYTSASKALGKRVGGFLSGDDLYLFPDGTYIYCEWADIMPVTVVDKGNWTVSEGLLQLTSDTEVTWDPSAERTYVLVRRASRSEEVLLVGTERALPYFESQAGDDPEFMLLLNAKVRVSVLGRRAATKVKANLMRKAWRPEYFQKKSR